MVDYKGVDVDPSYLYPSNPGGGYTPDFWDIMKDLGVNVIRVDMWKWNHHAPPAEIEQMMALAGAGIRWAFLIQEVYENYYPHDIESAKVAVHDFIVGGGWVGDDRIVFWDIKDEPDLQYPENIVFLREIANYIKTIDPTTPVSIGGWHTGGSWQAISDLDKIIDFIDIVQVVQYPNPRASDIYAYTKAHVAAIKERSQGKPIIYHWGLQSGPSSHYPVTFTEAEQAQLYQDTLKALFEANILGSFAYQLSLDWSSWSMIRQNLTYKPSADVLKKWYKTTLISSTGLLLPIAIIVGVLYFLGRKS